MLFDADRTLFDFDVSEKKAFSKIVPKYGVPFTEENYILFKRINDEHWNLLEKGEVEKRRMLVRRFEFFLSALGVSSERAADLNDEYLHALSEESLAFEESLPLLTELNRRGKRIFLITNGVDFVQNGRISRSPLKVFFEKVFISDEIGYEKPSTKFFDVVMRSIDGFNKEKAVVIGDSLSGDVKGANQSGLDCVWLNKNNAALPDEYKANYIINSLNELYEILC